MSRKHFHRPMIPTGGPKQAAVLQIQHWLNLLAAAEQLQRQGVLHAALTGYYRIMQKLGVQNEIGRRAAFLTALACYQLRIYDEAVLLMEGVRNLKWDDHNVHYNLGLIYGAARQPEDAAEAYRIALALKPDFVAAENNLGNTLRELGDVEGARLCYDRVLAKDPTDPHARYNLAHVVLLHGNLGRGFRLYESRWDIPAWQAEYGRPDVTSPRLSLSDTPAHVFVHQEQGIGDTLQFLRMIPKLLERGHTVTFEAPVELAPWLKRRALGFTVISRGDPIPSHDRHIPLLSLPVLFELTTDADVPAVLPIPVELPAPLWTAPGDTRDVIGIAWAGNPMHHNDHHRSAPLEHLAPLFTRPNTRFVSLQILDRGVELQTAMSKLPIGENSEIVDVSAHLRDLEATAALMQRCKAVVCVDTSIAHLGGTLGVPTFVLTSWLSEWRWQLERPDSAWYPSVRLVRQPTLGDWTAAATEALRLLETV